MHLSNAPLEVYVDEVPFIFRGALLVIDQFCPVRQCLSRCGQITFDIADAALHIREDRQGGWKFLEKGRRTLKLWQVRAACPKCKFPFIVSIFPRLDL